MTHRPHRSAAQWQTLVDRQARSSHSAAEFCRQHDLGYASFMQWRARLASNGAQDIALESQGSVPHFIELTGGTEPGGSDHRSAAASENSALLIELDLGDGLQLRLSRGG